MMEGMGGFAGPEWNSVKDDGGASAAWRRLGTDRKAGAVVQSARRPLPEDIEAENRCRDVRSTSRTPAPAINLNPIRQIQMAGVDGKSRELSRDILARKSSAFTGNTC
jgi:hypothetical protein